MCPAGYVISNHNAASCEACPSGTYRSSSLDVCTPCAAAYPDDIVLWLTDEVAASSITNCQGEYQSTLAHIYGGGHCVPELRN